MFIERAMLYVLREKRAVRNQRFTQAMFWDEDLLYGYISGQICLILKWCREGFPRSLEEMVKVSLHLVQKPLLPLEETF